MGSDSRFTINFCSTAVSDVATFEERLMHVVLEDSKSINSFHPRISPSEARVLNDPQSSQQGLRLLGFALGGSATCLIFEIWAGGQW